MKTPQKIPALKLCRGSILLCVLTLSILSILFCNIQSADASHAPIPTISFDAGSYTLAENAIITVEDDTFEGNTIFDEVITVTVSAADTGNSIELELIEDADTGTFRNTALIFMDGSDLFTLDSTVLVSFTDSSQNTLTGEVDVIEPIDGGYVIIRSLDPSSGFAVRDDIDPLIMTETDGSDTGFFTGIFGFTTGATVGNNLGAVLGDIIQVDYGGGEVSNGLLIPNPVNSVGALSVVVDPPTYDTMTATYTYTGGSVSAVATMGGSGAGGAGGGGPVLPSLSLVIDVLAGVLGGGGIDRTAPSLVTSNPSIFGNLFADPLKPVSPTTNPSAPLRINDNGYFPTGKTITINPTQLSTGENVGLTLSFLEASSVQHVALYFVDENSDQLSDTDPAIIYDNGNVIKSDPDGMLGDQITFTKSREGFRSIFNFGFSIDEPTNRHLGIVVWDEKKNSVITNIRDAFSVSGEPVPQEENHLVLQDAGQYIITQDGVVDMQAQSDTIPQQQAGWFYSNSIGRLDRHDMASLHNTIDNEQARADTITDNFNLDTETFVADDEKKPYDTSKRAPELTWSNVGHKLRNIANTPDENTELLKQLLWQEHLKAEKTLKSLFVKSIYHYED